MIGNCRFAVSLAMLSFLYAQQTQPPLVNKGKDLFARRCMGCHRMDEIRVGPRLRNVFGRSPGADPGFPYSDGLKAARFQWNESTLDRWLTDPEGLVPGSDMAFRMPSPEERAAIIAYLKNMNAK